MLSRFEITSSSYGEARVNTVVIIKKIRLKRNHFSANQFLIFTNAFGYEKLAISKRLNKTFSPQQSSLSRNKMKQNMQLFRVKMRTMTLSRNDKNSRMQETNSWNHYSAYQLLPQLPEAESSFFTFLSVNNLCNALKKRCQDFYIIAKIMKW